MESLWHRQRLSEAAVGVSAAVAALAETGAKRRYCEAEKEVDLLFLSLKPGREIPAALPDAARDKKKRCSSFRARARALAREKKMEADIQYENLFPFFRLGNKNSVKFLRFTSPGYKR